MTKQLNSDTGWDGDGFLRHSPGPAVEADAPPYWRNLLESCANWLDSRSRCQVLHIQPDPDEGGGYASLMRDYAQKLRELRATLPTQETLQADRNMTSDEYAALKAPISTPDRVKCKLCGGLGLRPDDIGSSRTNWTECSHNDASDGKQPLTRKQIDDFDTHRRAWRNALEIAMQHAPAATEDMDDKAYWAHELRAFDRAYAELDSTSPSVAPDQETPQAEVMTDEQKSMIESAAKEVFQMLPGWCGQPCIACEERDKAIAQPPSQDVTAEYLEWLKTKSRSTGVAGNEAWNAGVAWARSIESKSALLDQATKCGAQLTGKPDGSEAITVVFTIQAWRQFADTLTQTSVHKE